MARLHLGCSPLPQEAGNPASSVILPMTLLGATSPHPNPRSLLSERTSAARTDISSTVLDNKCRKIIAGESREMHVECSQQGASQLG